MKSYSFNVTDPASPVAGESHSAFQAVTEGYSAVINSDKAISGTAVKSLFGTAVLLGNVLGVKAKTGEWGVAVTEGLSFTIGE